VLSLPGARRKDGESELLCLRSPSRNGTGSEIGPDPDPVLPADLLLVRWSRAAPAQGHVRCGTRAQVVDAVAARWQGLLGSPRRSQARRGGTEQSDRPRRPSATACGEQVNGYRRRPARGCSRRWRIGTRSRSASHPALSLLVRCGGLGVWPDDCCCVPVGRVVVGWGSGGEPGRVFGGLFRVGSLGGRGYLWG